MLKKGMLGAAFALLVAGAGAFAQKQQVMLDKVVAVVGSSSILYSEVADHARQLTAQDYEEYDLLIGMEGANLKNMQRICGGDPAGKMHWLLDYTDRPGDVADPWYTGDFEATWRDVSEGCKCLLAEIEKSGI